MLSQLGVLAETSMKKIKTKTKHHAIVPATLGGCGGLAQLWEALAELWEALGELWEGLYKEKLSCVIRAAGPSEIKVAPPPPTPLGETIRD